MIKVDTHIKDHLNPAYKKYDIDIITSYLEKLRLKSNRSYWNQFGKIMDCLNFINKDLQNIKRKDIKKFFREIVDKKTYVINIHTGNRKGKRNIHDTRAKIQRVVKDKENEQCRLIGISTKEVYRATLKSFFSYVEDVLEDDDIEYYNPVPSKKSFQFTEHETDIKKFSSMAEEVYSDDEIIRILELSKKKLRDFIVFSILIVAGPRISEVLSIRIRDININERYFETGFVKDARKTSMRVKEALLFFFPEKLRHYLKKYINYLGDNEEWLFPGRNTGNHILVDSFRSHVKRNYGPKYTRFHRFRKTLITRRLLEMGCPLWISKGLMNHDSNDVEVSHYLKMSIEEKRDFYEKYFPYNHLPYI